MCFLDKRIELFSKIEAENFLPKLIVQLNKDFQMAHVSESIADHLLLEEVNNRLNDILFSLITNHYDDYLNLLYRIDISEKELAAVKGASLKENMNEISFLIIKREFQKVWFKSRT